MAVSSDELERLAAPVPCRAAELALPRNQSYERTVGRMTVCPECGQETVYEASMGPLKVTPFEVFWRGVGQGSPGGQQHRILTSLVRYGFASHFALQLQTGENATYGVVTVQICKLRRWLKSRAIPASIENRSGVGYMLKLDT